MGIRGFVGGTSLVIGLAAASLVWTPPASARVHIGVGIAIPGISIGVGNCWRCGYWAPPPVWYRPVYAAPVYYPAVTWYPPPVYYPVARYYARPRVHYGHGYRYGYHGYLWRNGRGYYRGRGYARHGNRGVYYRHRR